MKCIKSRSGTTIERVKDDIARQRVSTGTWSYCSKEQWKQQTRHDSAEAKVDSTDASSKAKVHGLKAKDRKKLSKKK